MLCGFMAVGTRYSLAIFAVFFSWSGSKRMSNEIKKPFRVLSLDGGGIRGLYSAIILNTLLKRFKCENVDFGKGFDLIVGTSTGGILATGITAGIPLSQIIQIYRDNGKEIFHDPIPDGKFKLFRWIYRNRNTPANDIKKLKDALRKCFGETTLDSLYARRKIALCVTAVDCVDHAPFIFKTPHTGHLTRDKGYSLVDVCIATSSAPIIFPLATAPSPEDAEVDKFFVDGGLWANNPVLVGIIEALQLSGGKPVEIFSVGSFAPPKGKVINRGKANWGIYQWKAGIGVMEMSMDAQTKAYEDMARKLAKSFTSLGKKISIIRIGDDTAFSADQIPLLGLDNASDGAMKTISSLVGKSADKIFSQAIDENGLGRLVPFFDELKAKRD